VKEPESYEDYLDKLNKKCLKYIKAFCKTAGGEELHQLRVNIKKLKALFTLLEKVHGSFHFKKSFKPYKRVFKQAGKIRDEELQVEMMANLPKSLKSPEPEKIKAKITEQIEAFIQKCDHYEHMLENAGKHNEKWLKQLKRKDVEDYFINFLQDVKTACFRLKSTAKLHPFRKLVKEFIYNADLLDNKQMRAFKLKNTLALMDEFQDQAGRWHDKKLMIKSLEKEKKRKGGTAYIARIKSENEKLLVQVEILLSRLRIKFAEQ
jgi:CHAD domain-containing protein